MKLEEYFAENPHVALGFSGGVDSSYLLYKAVECGADVRPYFLKTQFQTTEELEAAGRFAEKAGSSICCIYFDVLNIPDIVENGADRCYYCKRALFTEIVSAAEADGYSVVIDGTNASDDVADRPGFRAITELGVQSPLRICGVTKDMIRRELRETGFELWNDPSNSCLATRIPCGTRISENYLTRVYETEKILKSMGFYDLRVRAFGGAARIQLKAEQMEKLIAVKDDIRKRFEPYFKDVFLDLTSR